MARRTLQPCPVRRFALLALVLGLTGAPLCAAERIALVIGMGDYRAVVKLDNPVNDARAVGDTLERVGFDVTTLLDVTAADLRAAVADFAFRAETSDLALVYYAGHGVEVQGKNFLIPIDADVSSNRDIQRVAVSLDDLLAAVDGARKMRVVILDSCRDDPFGGALDPTGPETTGAAFPGTRSGGGGLAPPVPDRGTLVAFAAKDGEVALDGDGAHSPFAQALIDTLPEPVEISLLFRQVRDTVLQATGNRQEPHTYGSLPGTPFFLAGEKAEKQSGWAPGTAWSRVPTDQVSRLVVSAVQGDARSILGLARMRLNPGDPAFAPGDAAALLERAIEAGSPEAQFELAQLYERGLGVAQSDARALALYRAAAAQGYAEAINDLGFLYARGRLGVAPDPAGALALFERAAKLRQPQALFNFAALIDAGSVAGQGAEEAASHLYRALRTGAPDVYEVLRDDPDRFRRETRRALQQRLAENGFQTGPADGDFGPETLAALRAAYGLTEQDIRSDSR